MVLKLIGLSKHVMFTFIKTIILLILNFVLNKADSSCNNSLITSLVSSPPYDVLISLQLQSFDGNLSLKDNEDFAKDFGNIHHFPPLAVLHPKTVSDISRTIKHIYQKGSDSDSEFELKVAARGHGHSLQGQAQAHQGLVISMESLQSPEMKIHSGDFPYVDVSGGELWINILHETLKYGLAPKSWTDYLHLTVGGTLSNAGISGQAFRHGPQINNVFQLEVVTGKGEVVTCSENRNADLFHSVLGGLGQFGIITRARISLEPAPKMVKWIRVLYSDFSTFTENQEYLISLKDTFDYIEGFVIINRIGILNGWRLSFDPKDPLQASQFNSDGKTFYCLEMAKYFNPDEAEVMNQSVDHLLSQLDYIPPTLFLSEVSYVEFLDRVHVSEKKLRAQGLWEVHHPWLNLMIPRSVIHDFNVQVFGNIIKDTSNGPVLIYPVNQTRWNSKTSLVTPEEDVFYLVAFLSSAVPFSTSENSLEYILNQNKRILDFCTHAQLNVKQYLPHYSTQEEWQAHFGSQWRTFMERKRTYDPLALLAPGHRIFQKKAGNENFKLGKYTAAVENYTAALSSNIKSRPFAAICFGNRAAAHQASGQIADAIADCSMAMALDGNYAKAISRRATLHEMVRDYEQAACDLRRLISVLGSQSNEKAKHSQSPNESIGGKESRQAQQRLLTVEDHAKMGTPLDFYLILGIKPADAAADIKKAYHKAALRHHPDKAGQLLARSEVGDEGHVWKEVSQEVHKDADRLFKMIGEAYAVLSDPAKRSEYDMEEDIRKLYKQSNGGGTGRRSSNVYGNGRSPDDYRSSYDRTSNRRYGHHWKTYGDSYSRW